MRTVLDARTSSRYGARSRGGIHTVLDVETALAADTAARLRDRLAAGERLSGPAARRALTAAAQAPASKAALSRAPSYTRPAPTSPATALCSTTTPRP